MFGTGSQLATILLEVGNIVESVKIYGVVVGMNDPNHAVLLSLTIDFTSGSCIYRCVDKKFTDEHGTKPLG